jgi:hypothetical protein
MLNKLLKYIYLKYFLISLLLGLLYIYIDNSKQDIYVYPTLSNYDKIEYKDKADNCFIYTFNEVKCPTDSNEIHNIPLQ